MKANELIKELKKFKEQDVNVFVLGGNSCITTKTEENFISHLKIRGLLK